MKIHVIVDFMHIYYKYYFQLKAGKLRKLSSAIEYNGSTIEKDTTLIYYPLRDIEGIRKEMEARGHDITMSVCFDSKSIREDEEHGEEYKSKRTNKLTDENYKDVSIIRELLEGAGHNIYKCDGYEADDLVNSLVEFYKDDYEFTVIYTNDKDLMVNIGDTVGVMRFKQTKGYTQISNSNYTSYLYEEFKGANIPYNGIALYLASVGDKSDDIKGIAKFGKVAFNKLIDNLYELGSINWEEAGDFDKMEEIIQTCKHFLSDNQFEELKASFKMVRSRKVELEPPNNKSTKELREIAYKPLNMISLMP